MTTSILTNLLEPFCELYYKYQKSLDIQQANINTVRNYGFPTSYAINFGFEIYQPFDLNDINLQPGVFTYNNSYNVLPNLENATSIAVQNLIELQDLPTMGIGTVNYVNKVLPLKVTIEQNSNSVIGIASSYETNGIPYDSYYNLNETITRNFESSLINDSDLSALMFIVLEDATFQGTKNNWTVLPSSLYRAEIQTFRYSNGYGQFYSLAANQSFIPSNISVNLAISSNLYNCTYMNVYNWANTLSWEPDFQTWYDLYKNTLPPFLHQFLIDYFGLT